MAIMLQENVKVNNLQKLTIPKILENLIIIIDVIDAIDVIDKCLRAKRAEAFFILPVQKKCVFLQYDYEHTESDTGSNGKLVQRLRRPH